MVFRPNTFGKYVLLKRIAIGGMAEVFRAKAFGAEGFEKVAAVKRMLPHLSSDNQFVDMFINEAKLAANLNHANIVQIYDFGCIDNLYFISMEYVHGKDIADLIRVLRERNLTTPTELACHVFIEILNGLDYAHRLIDPYGEPVKLIHRDMSPHNIILSYEGEVKLVDFGIAKAASSTVHTTGGVLKGKYSYMSPEQAHGMPLDHRSDIFSLGICFYELLTLTKMFHADSDLAVLEKVRETEFVRPSEINDSIPDELEDILLKALEKNPDDRYATAAEWRDELEQFLFSNNLHYSTSWLAGFMREIFREVVEREQDEFAEDAAVVHKLRSEARRAARLDSTPLVGPDTVVIKKGSGVSDAEIEDTSVRQDTIREESFDSDTFTDQSLSEEVSGPIEISDDEVMEIGQPDEDDDENYLETAKLDRPNPVVFRQIEKALAAKKKNKARSAARARGPIREVGGPDSENTFSDDDTDKEKRDALRFLMDSTEPERSDSASQPLDMGEFDKERSTMPQNGPDMRPLGPQTQPEGEPLSSSSRGFPFGILFSVLLVAVVIGGVAAFVFHNNDDQKPQTDGGVNTAVTGPDTKTESLDASKPEVVKKAEEPAILSSLDAGQPTLQGADQKPSPKETIAEAKDPKTVPREVEPKIVKTPIKPPVKKKTRPPKRRKKRRKRRRKKVVAKKPKAEKGFGKVDVGVPAGWAFVYIDGVKVRTTPLLNYRLKAGRHVVELKDGEGNIIHRWNIRLRANGKVKLLHQ
ncbi:MAG: serine/threonine protein kinase [Deltaproteobacteria bacterium]|nr:serine/threonine protein kinase [Deltaproteobacteria bacterium]